MAIEAEGARGDGGHAAGGLEGRAGEETRRIGKRKRLQRSRRRRETRSRCQSSERSHPNFIFKLLQLTNIDRRHVWKPPIFSYSEFIDKEFEKNEDS